jgi:hypothetical protein
MDARVDSLDVAAAPVRGARRWDDLPLHIHDLQRSSLDTPHGGPPSGPYFVTPAARAIAVDRHLHTRHMRAA